MHKRGSINGILYTSLEEMEEWRENKGSKMKVGKIRIPMKEINLYIPESTCLREEREFKEWITKKGYNCIKLIPQLVNYTGEEEKVIKEAREKFPVLKNVDFFGAGIPDYFIFNGEEYCFVEIKNGSDSIHPNQIKWFMENEDLNSKVLVIYPK